MKLELFNIGKHGGFVVFVHMLDLSMKIDVLVAEIKYLLKLSLDCYNVLTCCIFCGVVLEIVD